MCYTLGAEKIILNYFAHSDNCTLSLSSLNDLAGEIIRRCYNGIMVHTNRDAVVVQVSNLSDVLRLEDQKIVLVNRNNFVLNNISLLNEEIPEAVRNKCMEVCAKYGEKQQM